MESLAIRLASHWLSYCGGSPITYCRNAIPRAIPPVVWRVERIKSRVLNRSSEEVDS